MNKMLLDCKLNFFQRYCIMRDNKTIFEGYPAEVKHKLTRQEWETLCNVEVIDERDFFETRVIELKSEERDVKKEFYKELKNYENKKEKVK